MMIIQVPSMYDEKVETWTIRVDGKSVGYIEKVEDDFFMIYGKNVETRETYLWSSASSLEAAEKSAGEMTMEMSV